jgi:hypothetical protein
MLELDAIINEDDGIKVVILSYGKPDVMKSAA